MPFAGRRGKALVIRCGTLGHERPFSNGPGDVKGLPVRQTPDSASVDGHSSFPLRERSCPMGRGCNVCSQVSPAGYLLLSVVSAKVNASMMRLERGVVRQS